MMCTDDGEWARSIMDDIPDFRVGDRIKDVKQDPSANGAFILGTVERTGERGSIPLISLGGTRDPPYAAGFAQDNAAILGGPLAANKAPIKPAPPRPPSSKGPVVMTTSYGMGAPAEEEEESYGTLTHNPASEPDGALYGATIPVNTTEPAEEEMYGATIPTNAGRAPPPVPPPAGVGDDEMYGEMEPAPHQRAPPAPAGDDETYGIADAAPPPPGKRAPPMPPPPAGGAVDDDLYGEFEAPTPPVKPAAPPPMPPASSLSMKAPAPAPPAAGEDEELYAVFDEGSNAPPPPLPKPAGRLVELDRGGGKKIGVSLQDSSSAEGYMSIKTVNPGSQADGKLTAGEQILSLNGISTQGMNMRAAVGVITKTSVLKLMMAL